MRAIGATLTAAQILDSLPPLVRVTFEKAGESDVVYTQTRIISIDHTERIWSQSAKFILDNADGSLTGVDYIGWECELAWGVDTGGGGTYSPVGALYVNGCQSVSMKGRMVYVVELMGFADLMDKDFATEERLFTASSTYTIKDLINGLVAADETIFPCFFGTAEDYSAVQYDSEDDLIDSFVPGALFHVEQGQTRLSVLKELLSYTKCVARFEYGGAIHILEPTISGTSYDYEYSLSAGAHKFFRKSIRTRLVQPNVITVRTPEYAPIAYTGTATDATSEAARVSTKVYEMNVPSDIIATAMATAMLQRFTLGAQTGAAEVPMNCGQEIWDYIKITDSRQSDSHTGVVQVIERHYEAWNGQDEEAWLMWIQFGDGSSQMGTLALYDPEEEDNPIYKEIERIWVFLNELAWTVADFAYRVSHFWLTKWLTVTHRFVNVHGLDADKEVYPIRGCSYFATDTERLYVCFFDGVWTWYASCCALIGIYKEQAFAIEIMTPTVTLTTPVETTETASTATPSETVPIPTVGTPATAVNSPAAVGGAIADDGGSQTDETTPANEATADDMTLLPATPAVNDAYYFGKNVVWDWLSLYISTAGVGTWTIVWEYYDGDSWELLPSVYDTSAGFTSVGEQSVSFTRPGDWATSDIILEGLYWIRARVSAYSAVTTQPLGQQVWIGIH